MQTKKLSTVSQSMWDKMAKKEYTSEYSMDILQNANKTELDALVFSGNIPLVAPLQESVPIKSKAPWE